MPATLTLEDVRAAAARLGDRVRRTPLVAAAPARGPLPGRCWLKLECLQVTGSFKARGALNRALLLDAAAAARGLVTASGGNHGAGVAYAARLRGCPARVFVPTSTPADKVARLRSWGAEVVVAGAVWDDANARALEDAARTGATYVHPFADPAVAAGQGTVGLELVEQLPRVDTVVVAIGGGGLAAGVGVAVHGLRPEVRVVGVEPVGAATLHDSLRAGRPVTLERIATAAGTLAPLRSDAFNVALVERHVARVALVDDDAMRDAARWLWREHGVGAELGGAAAVAALRAGAYRPDEGEQVAVLVCGAGADALAPGGPPAR